MKDRVLAVVAAIGALAYLYADWGIPSVQLGDPLGPRAFPALVGSLLFISAVLLLIESWVRRPAPARLPDLVGDGLGVDIRRNASHEPILLAMLAWTICYYLAFEPVGYAIATPIYLFALLCFFHPRRHLTNVLIAAGFTGVAYIIFSQLLGVQLPPGLLGLFSS